MMVTICFMEMLKVKGANGITLRLKDLFSFIGNIQGVCWQSAKAKLKNRHFIGGYRGSKPFFLTLQTGRKFPLGTEENIICIFDSGNM